MVQDMGQSLTDKQTEYEKFLDKFLKITPFICAMMVVGIHSYNAGGIN